MKPTLVELAHILADFDKNIPPVFVDAALVRDNIVSQAEPHEEMLACRPNIAHKPPCLA
ncbi:hypothetical protein [Pseudomonas sp. PNPG3]|uniref:hypothetical protein n=1 Tax=Pseudomonas sp. PNPG3 TaxID=2919497 RepID=UPI001FFD1149|nr:hypothetical protein [Pseudomonas sp. PNPG3]MCK2124815.1 hypothetical protein [Pseudomonas sp. PNPG3]